MSSATPDLHRPYLVIPKLIEQPTWGGQYIVNAKGWDNHPDLGKLRIGQSYELFSGSNLSLLDSTENPEFTGELTDRDAVATATNIPNSIPLAELLAASAAGTLGPEIIAERGPHLELLIKYTQALGNSFQVHIHDGVKSPIWKPKPESWYYFEPGLVTLGVKPGLIWADYEEAVTTIAAGAEALGHQVKAGTISYQHAQTELAALVKKNDPWQFVNTVPVQAGQLVDMSSGGIHHSWEEDIKLAPHGNVLYELQFEALDNISTFRNFDKGKMQSDGTVRPLQINEYFQAIDRTPAANDPATHLRDPEPVTKTTAYNLYRLLASRHYNLDRLTLAAPDTVYRETIRRFKHLFVKSGRIKVTAGSTSVTLTTAHACFIPAAAGHYTVTNLAGRSEVLISY